MRSVLNWGRVVKMEMVGGRSVVVERDIQGRGPLEEFRVVKFVVGRYVLLTVYTWGLGLGGDSGSEKKRW